MTFKQQIDKDMKEQLRKDLNKEFNLSDKITKNAITEEGFTLKVRYVKDFIKKLIEYQCLKIELSKKSLIQGDFEEASIACCIDNIMKIKEFAGDKLI